MTSLHEKLNLPILIETAPFLNYVWLLAGPYTLTPPTNFKVIADSPRSLQLTWDAPDFPLKIYYYSVECFPTKLQKTINAEFSSMTIKLDKLKPNTEYSCRVRAYGKRKVGIWSPFVKAITLDDGKSLNLCKLK